MEAAIFEQCYAMLPEAMLLVSGEGYVVAGNPAAGELFGHRTAALEGRELKDLVTESETKLSHFLLQCQRSREFLPGSLVGRSLNGSSVRCRVDGALITPRAGNASARILLRLLPREPATSRFIALNERIEALNKEIAQRQRAEAALVRANEELRRANSDLEQFAYSASHDLREPLRMVAIYSEMLQRRYQGRLDERADEYLQLAVEGARRMERLVADLLAYTQAVSPKEEAIVPVDADAVLRQALANLGNVIAESRAHVESGLLPMLAVRDVHLVQLFQNLISNAIKYRRETPPSIRIEASAEGEMWRISINDNGLGIAKEYNEQIFGLFKRLHTSHEYAGTGMGLAICQKIVHSYGGRIWVESEGEGNGSTFHFTLPGAEQDS